MKIHNIFIGDDTKFIPNYVRMTKHFGLFDKSEFHFFSSDHQKIRSLKPQVDPLIHPLNEDGFKKVLDLLRPGDSVVFHAFSHAQYSFIKQLPPDVKKVWIFWGYEGYHAMYYSGLVMNKSWLAANKHKRKKVFIKYLLNKYFIQHIKVFGKQTREIISQMDVCATWDLWGHRFVKKINPDIQTVHFSYYPAEWMFWPEKLPSMTHQKNIMLGNSISYTNNHIEALHYLKRISQSFDKVYLPLSYGNQPYYLRNVIRTGKRLLGDKFIPLNHFLPLEKYNQLFNNMRLVWMNHIRQQAAGNIFTAMAYGKPVILHPKSHLHFTFSKWGLKTYKPKNIPELMSQNPPDNIRIENHRIIWEKLSLHQNKNFFEIIGNEKS